MPNGIEPLKDLEARGDILIMRGLTGAWKDIPLPRLGRKNVNGQEVMEGGSGRWKTVFWDHLREAGRAGKRVDDGTCRVIPWSLCQLLIFVSLDRVYLFLGRCAYSRDGRRHKVAC